MTDILRPVLELSVIIPGIPACKKLSATDTA